MKSESPVIEIQKLVRRFGRTEAVNGLNLSVRPGRCYGLFGRNGAGKTTTVKCLLNLLRPNSGSVRLFGLDPCQDEVAVKSRLAYVPDAVAFYPWMTVREVFLYLASFRAAWNRQVEQELLDRFELDPAKKFHALSRGEKVQVALIGAISADPELLILDEPTSGLDPLVRREFIRTVIGAYQEADPEKRTVFVSTHMITEFEGLIDEFTVIDQGRELLTMETETARRKFKKVRLRFAQEPPPLQFDGLLETRRDGRELELIVSGGEESLRQALQAHAPEVWETEALTLEEIFLASLKLRRNGPCCSE